MIQHWDLSGEKATARPALANGEVDVFTMSPHLVLPDPGMPNFTELGLQHDPKLPLLVQASSHPDDVSLRRLAAPGRSAPGTARAASPLR